MKLTPGWITMRAHLFKTALIVSASWFCLILKLTQSLSRAIEKLDENGTHYRGQTCSNDLNDGFDDCIKREVCLRMQKDFGCFPPFFPLIYEDGKNKTYEVKIL